MSMYAYLERDLLREQDEPEPRMTLAEEIELRDEYLAYGIDMYTMKPFRPTEEAAFMNPAHSKYTNKKHQRNMYTVRIRNSQSDLFTVSQFTNKNAAIRLIQKFVGQGQQGQAEGHVYLNGTGEDVLLASYKNKAGKTVKEKI